MANEINWFEITVKKFVTLMKSFEINGFLAMFTNTEGNRMAFHSIK